MMTGDIDPLQTTKPDFVNLFLSIDVSVYNHIYIHIYTYNHEYVLAFIKWWT